MRLVLILSLLRCILLFMKFYICMHFYFSVCHLNRAIILDANCLLETSMWLKFWYWEFAKPTFTIPKNLLKKMILISWQQVPHQSWISFIKWWRITNINTKSYLKMMLVKGGEAFIIMVSKLGKGCLRLWDSDSLLNVKLLLWLLWHDILYWMNSKF